MGIEMKIICAFLSGEWENTVQFSSSRTIQLLHHYWTDKITHLQLNGYLVLSWEWKVTVRYK